MSQSKAKNDSLAAHTPLPADRFSHLPKTLDFDLAWKIGLEPLLWWLFMANEPQFDPNELAKVLLEHWPKKGLQNPEQAKKYLEITKKRLGRLKRVEK